MSQVLLSTQTYKCYCTSLCFFDSCLKCKVHSNDTGDVIQRDKNAQENKNEIKVLTQRLGLGCPLGIRSYSDQPPLAKYLNCFRRNFLIVYN